jgi:neutral ceramidase
LRIGQLLIAAVPGEFTTMAGRRLRDALNSEAANNGGPSSVKTVIAGLSNGYTHYITTFEEYQVCSSDIRLSVVFLKFN